MALLSLHNIDLSLGGPSLFNAVSLHIESGERVCLVGRNGAGKSTLMRLIGGEIAPDSGTLAWQNNARAAYLPQDVPEHLQGRVRDIVQGEGDAPDYEIDAMLSQLDLDGEADFRALSGGQQRRVLLARTLAAQPDVLLLDEPTNHLDIAAIQWLEEWLLRRSRTQNTALLFVTHDRAFLQNLATRIVEIDRAQLFSYACDYATFLERREARLESEAKTQGDLNTLLAQEEAWVRRGLKARTTRNEGRVRALQQLRDQSAARRKIQGKVEMQAQEVARSGHEVIVAEDANFGYDNAPHLITDFSTRILRGDKLGLVGPNGGGKSTLVKLLLGEIAPQSGRVKLGTRLQIAYFDQAKAALEENRSVRWNVAGENDTVLFNGQSRHIVSYLNEWLFERDRIHQPVSVLSGGERSRLLLARLFAQPANLLVLDEPTNDLDIETLELLENLLVEFAGTVITVSHDRAFLNNVVSSTLSPDGDGTWSEFVGGYDDLQRQRAAQNAPQVLAAPSSAKNGDERGKAQRARRISFKEKLELEGLPNLIEKLESENVALVEKMGDANFYQGDAATIAAATARLGEIEAELQRAFARWEELDAIEA